MALAAAAPASLRPLESSAVRGWLLGAVLATWFIPVNQLRVEWSINAQYAYGWVVPFLALYLFAERWKSRPHPQPAPRSGRWLGALAVLFAFVLLPLRLVAEAAPDWRFISWGLAVAVAGLSLCAICFTGGRPWLRHFLFPVCFFLVAVPWPVPLEQALVQRLMRCVASLCVEALSWWGVMAVQHGNVIQINSGAVGVEEACSGVRSLQTTLMIALFLGELFLFPLWRRLVLLGGGLVLAFLCNASRALALVSIYASGGPAGLEKYHDQVGLGVLAGSLLGLGLLAYALRSRPPHSAPPASPAIPPGRSLPRLAFILLLAWLACVEAGTEVWYRIHDPLDASAISWTVDFPTEKPGFHETPIPEIAHTMLRYNEGRSAAWADRNGDYWSMVFLRWFPGRASVQLARSHGPEVCLPASGMTLQSDLGVEPLPVQGRELPTHSFVFTLGGRTLYVFYCLAEDRQPGDGPASTRRRVTSFNRLDGVWAGRRNRGQQVLEVVVSGPANAEDARAATIRMLSGVMRSTVGHAAR